MFSPEAKSRSADGHLPMDTSALSFDTILEFVAWNMHDPGQMQANTRATFAVETIRCLT
jgi:hypothetical protein